MQSTVVLLTALLSLFRNVPQPQRGRIEAQHDAIVAMVDAASTAHAVPAGVIYVVGFLETHLGTDLGEGGGWGAPIDHRHRHTAGTVDTAARILEHSFTACHSWQGAIARFRSGLCTPWQAVHQQYVRRAVSLVERTYARAGVALPAEFRAAAPRRVLLAR